MTAEQVLAEDTPSPREAASAEATATVQTIRTTWELVEPDAGELAQHFYAKLFHLAPETRELFPANMEVQRSRLLRALVHVVQMVDRPAELTPFLAQLGRDHRKFGVITQHYESVGRALLGAIEAFAGQAWTPKVAKAWTDAFTIVASAMMSAAQGEHGPASWLGRVVDHERIGWDLAKVSILPSTPVPYRAGQYVSVETPQRPRLWRYLSPSNAPREDGRLEFHVRAVEGGWVSRAIVAHAHVGDTWRIGPPMGRMTVDRQSGRDLLMIGGGTGLAPLKALLDDMSQQPENPRAQVFVGGSTWDDLYDFTSLRRMSYDSPWLDVIPVVEREDVGSGAEIGTLAEVVTRYGAWADHDVFVCGSPAMIRATVSRMLVAGTPLDHIRYDPFTTD